jgi:hypothetical protein
MTIAETLPEFTRFGGKLHPRSQKPEVEAMLPTSPV